MSSILAHMQHQINSEFTELRKKINKLEDELSIIKKDKSEFYSYILSINKQLDIEGFNYILNKVLALIETNKPTFKVKKPKKK